MARPNVFVLLATATLLVGCGTHHPSAASASPSISAAVTASPSPSPYVFPTPSVSPTVKPSPTRTVPKPPVPNPLMTRTGSTAVALTFDDGPQGTWTPLVLDELKARGVKATFCLIGNQVAAHADLVRRIVNEGHTLCNHSWSHDFSLGRKSDAAIRADLVKTDNAIHAVVPGAPIPYFRQPGGNWTTAIHRVVKQLGKKSLGWDVDPWDWDKPGVAAIVKRVVSHTRTGSIILMHDGGGDRSQTLAALRQIIPMLQQRKFKLIPMPIPLP